MRTTKRFLAAALLLAGLPFIGCADAGDDGGTPTGPAAQYTPGMDFVGSTISTRTSGEVSQGMRFEILAQFLDGTGMPVEGVPLLAWDEEDGCFSFATDPTLTNADGKASIPVFVSPTCLEGSYTITVSTAPVEPLNGPRVDAFVHVYVRSSSVAAVTSISLETTTASVEIPADANFVATALATASCNLRMDYQAAGAGLSISWTSLGVPPDNPSLFAVTPTSAGALTVVVRAYCSGGSTYIVSDPVTVNVTGP